ncbi:hypothetical protein BDM02DRAFT_3182905 [Thelephora ganbajun]|uniref:Uncharacterized protein n=1 Tax=Thelephora ganbajun TaxID=370292 RepID=A0ACB6ZVB7_THEGA|nr:hypothetical protein BDM02DRAFT_3182905 [Thelephora ganbajun]
MAPLFLNYTILGLPRFQVFPLPIPDDTVFIEQVLQDACEKTGGIAKASKSEFWLLKRPIPFDQVEKNPWLLKSFVSLSDYATHRFHAEKLCDVLSNKFDDPKSLHVVLGLYSACKIFTPVLRDRYLTRLFSLSIKPKILDFSPTCTDDTTVKQSLALQPPTIAFR